MDSHLLIVGLLTFGFALASFFAYVMQKLKLPSIIGYLVAGYLIGPFSPGFVADTDISEQLAEIGVILMLFGVGLHFKLEDLLRVKKIAIPGAIAQTLVAALVTTILVYHIGWGVQSGIILGLAVGVASTVVLIRLLTENNILDTSKGHIAVGWLVVEDIFTVIFLLLLPTMAALTAGKELSFFNISMEIILVMAKFVILILFMFTIGHKIIVAILNNIARLRSQELFTLTILAIVFVIATSSSVIFGTSIALGAFIAGMVIGKTNVRHQAASNSLPLKDIFAVIFFLSIGMLFNPAAIATNFPLFMGILGVILLVKPAIAYLITVVLGYSLNTALTVAISLAQIGEFSFILAEQAMTLKLIPEDGFDLLVACAMISIAINPLYFKAIPWIENVKHRLFNTKADHPLNIKTEEELAKKVVIVGFGPIGREISTILKNEKFVSIIIEHNIDTVSSLSKEEHIIFGDATHSNILKEAYIEEANYLIITVPEFAKTASIIHAARTINPDINILTRVQYIKEIPSIEKLNVKYICTEEETLDAFVSFIREALTVKPL